MKNILLIGIDGGATKVSGWVITYREQTQLFQISDINLQKKYSDYPDHNSGYTPVDIKTQLSEMNKEIHLTNEEKKQGDVYMNATADVIIGLLKKFPEKKALIGIGMPGLKTADKRGIATIANGPRMPGFSEFIELRINEKNLVLGSPIAHIGSDADYCGLGEEYSEDGLFKDVQNAYYLGGGTGVADALKLEEKLIPFDQAKSWIAKAWEMQCDKGISFERYASAAGIQFIYSRYSNIPVEELNNNHIYPPQILEKALSDDKAAVDTINDVSIYIATLIYERITTIYSGWSGLFSFVNPARELTKKDHKYRGILLDRIIVGQRLGDLLDDSKPTPLLWSRIIERLSELLNKNNENRLKKKYLQNGRFREDFITISKLREAPAIGAGVDAWLTYNKR
ncbi:MAG: ROK family protein [Bacteroidetes bacterium]|nr:ROK family protein [Bacteroidota bacterium]